MENPIITKASFNFLKKLEKNNNARERGGKAENFRKEVGNIFTLAGGRYKQQKTTNKRKTRGESLLGKMSVGGLNLLSTH